jgi:hypothetical protein
MFGMMIGIGPLQLNYDSLKTGPPALFYNQYGWQKVANTLAIEQPPPTGFSFCKDPAGNQASFCKGLESLLQADFKSAKACASRAGAPPGTSLAKRLEHWLLANSGGLPARLRQHRNESVQCIRNGI